MPSFNRIWIVLIFIAGLSDVSAYAVQSTNLLTNGSFESGNYVYGSHGAPREADALPGDSTTISGWTVTSQCDVCIVANGNLANLTAEDGSIYLDLTGFKDATPYAGITQTIPTTIGQQYLLSFWLGCSNNVPGNFTSYNGPVAVTASAGSTSALFTDPTTAYGNQWQQYSLAFTATATTTPIEIDGQLATGGKDLGLDNVSVTAVPEPTTAIASLTMLGVAAIRRCGRRQ